MKEELGFVLLAIAAWQVFMAMRIAKINKSGESDESKIKKAEKLDTTSRYVQIFALILVLVLIFLEMRA
ncbi:hypothetical protein [Hydrogenophaga sp.]|uniref:hypothetical protein n=1 Tax=Hydrogenophaga sp. TaxID=1904254 RepID=UPI002720721E|nr:hypothetical protein [Hydrogenophaga sp.]MDO9434966.1 hypothetical protein [Hydrogenophaga sp.]